MSLLVTESKNPVSPIKVKEPEVSRARAIQICQEKYPQEYKIKRLLALAIAITAIALLVIPATASALAALSVCTFGVGLAIAAPIVLLATLLLIKRIDAQTIYWSGEVARNIIKKHEEKAEKEAQKANKIEVKPPPA